MSNGLEWHITGLWYPEETTVVYYGRISDPSDGLVTIPLNDSRLAEVTMSIFDPAAAALVGKTYQRCLKVYHRDILEFWGPIKLIDVDMAAGTIKLSAVDPSLRLIRHQLRRGDIGGDLGAASGDRADVSIDHFGLRLLRDAGLNTTDQTARGVPDLGIIDGSNDFEEASGFRMGVTRGDPVWGQMTQLSQSLGPDFELGPIEGVPGAYAELNTYAAQGSDVADTVVFQYGLGKQNVENVSLEEGAQYTTHVHVLSRDLKYVVTSADVESSAETGPYVDWDATDFDSANAETAETTVAVLTAHGQDILRAYGRPLQTVQLELPINAESDYQFRVDFALGDKVGVSARLGNVEIGTADDGWHKHRITTVRLLQANADNATRVALDVVPDRVGIAGDTIDGDEI